MCVIYDRHEKRSINRKITFLLILQNVLLFIFYAVATYNLIIIGLNMWFYSISPLIPSTNSIIVLLLLWLNNTIVQ